jgi:predicted transcriptional regulator
MGQETVKLELIEWLTKLEDDEIIEYLKVVKDSRSKNTDWWNALTDSQKQGIERGLSDIEQGRTIPHEEVKKKYGL